MRLGIALDCTKATGKGACAYFESIGLPPTAIVAVGSDRLSPSACLTLLYDCRDGGYIFCGKRREDIGYDSFLRYGGERADRRLVCKRSAPYAVRQRRMVMCAYLRRCGCDIVCVVTHDRPAINEQAREKTIALPYGLRENDVICFLQSAEQTLLPKILLQ